MEQYILALDQGTTSSRAIVFNKSGKVVSIAQKEYEQYYPKRGWVEHDPNEIWYTQASVAVEALSRAEISSEQISAMGITNQRETTIVWDRETGEPIYNAIVWQDRRVAAFCDELRKDGKAECIKQKTGLLIDAYFSAAKIKWILDNVEGAREKAEAGKLAFGTVDSWLVWKFTSGRLHITDVSNACRTMLYNIREMKWDNELLDVFNIPANMLPEVHSSSEIYGKTCTTLFDSEIKIGGIIGDQQAALFGHKCFSSGTLKNTYGTGCFLMLNTGSQIVDSQNNLLSTIAWQIGDKVTYALEGSVFIGGALVQWLRDNMNFFEVAAEVEDLANSVDDNGGIYVVPSFAGLGAPYWDQYSRGLIIGITRGTETGHIARASLESIAFQVYDLIQAMQADYTKKEFKELRVDGMPSTNDILMHFQSDILGYDIKKPELFEITALGAAYLAGLASGFWNSIDEIEANNNELSIYTPKMEEDKVEELLYFWHKAVDKTKGWLKRE